MNISRKNIYRGLAAVFLLLVLWLLMRSQPLRVDTGKVETGSMQITVDEQGETRSHDRFTVTSPVAGKLIRIELHDGDAVKQGQVLAQIEPVPLSTRERNEQSARIAAAESQQRAAEEQVRHGVEDLALARRESERVAKLVKDGFMTRQMAEQVRNAELTIANEVDAARFRAKSAAAEVKLAQSGLLAEKGAPFNVLSPVSGRVLRIGDASERVVAAGTPLMTLGDLSKLEVQIELLSTEAVKVRPGMEVLLDGWGGKQILNGRVKYVEPFAYTKVSALGIEEKRSNVIVDFSDDPAALGDGYRVNARIVIWSAGQVLKVPASALFRCGEEWCAFRVENGMAKRRTVKIGQRNAQDAEVLEGLQAGDVVIRHPSNQVEDGIKVLG